DATIGALTYQGQRAHKLHADVEVAGGMLTIRELSVADFAGIGGSVKGTLQAKNAEPSVDLTFDVTASDLARAFQVAGAPPPAAAARIGKVTARGSAQGTLQAASFKGEIGALGGSVGLDGNVQSPPGTPRIDMAVQLR